MLACGHFARHTNYVNINSEFDEVASPRDGESGLSESCADCEEVDRREILV